MDWFNALDHEYPRMPFFYYCFVVGNTVEIEKKVLLIILWA
jgi:hypothetical protein